MVLAAWHSSSDCGLKRITFRRLSHELFGWMVFILISPESSWLSFCSFWTLIAATNASVLLEANYKACANGWVEVERRSLPA